MSDMPRPGDDVPRFSRPDPPSPAGPPPAPDRPPASGWSPGVPSPPVSSSPDAAPPAYAAFGHEPVSPSGPRSGLLLAGGIVAIVLSVLVGFLGIALLLIGEAIDGFAASTDGFVGAIRVLGLLVLAFAVFGGVSGVGAILRRGWGRICSIVFGGVNSLFALLGLVGDSDGRGATLVYLAISAAIVILCAKGPASS